MRNALLLSWLGAFFCTAALAAEPPAFEFAARADRVAITSAGRPVATYVFRDEKIPRPYYCDVHAPGGARITRNHPPIEGQDLTDHDLLHPGIWLAFGDLNGADFWRNKARIEQVEFIEPPRVKGNVFSFVARNAYQAPAGADGGTKWRRLGDEIARRTIEKTADGYLFRWDSRFIPNDAPLVFGDQEEMGLGVRLHTPLAVAQNGSILDSEGRRDEKQVWGKQARWCLYSGAAGTDRVGVLLAPAARNFGPSWFHARDYGLAAGNPFGKNAFTGGEKSRVVVPVGDELRLSYSLLVFQTPEDRPLDAAGVYERLSAAE